MYIPQMCKLVEELCPNPWAGRWSSPHGEGSDKGLQIYLEDCLPICAFKGVLSLSDLEPISELAKHNLTVWLSMMTVVCGPLQLNPQSMEELMEIGNDTLCLAVVTCLVSV